MLTLREVTSPAEASSSSIKFFETETVYDFLHDLWQKDTHFFSVSVSLRNQNHLTFSPVSLRTLKQI